MRCRVALRFAVVMMTCVTLWVGAMGLVSGAHTERANPGSLFVTVSGTGTACSRAQPCGLQTALDQSVAGDVLYVGAGTYTGSGTAVATITKGITLYGGWNGAASGAVVRDPVAYRSILDGQGARRVVYIYGGFACTVDGFTIQNGNATAEPYGHFGGGIYSRLAWPLVANNVITGNTAAAPATDSAGYGGGVYIANAMHSAVIRGNQVVGNVATRSGQGWGGGLYIFFSDGAQVLDNVILNNTAAITVSGGSGGGVAVVMSNSCTLSGNTVESNQADAGAPSYEGWGGGVYLDGGSDIVLSKNRIRNNVGDMAGMGKGGGVAAFSSNRLVCADNLLEGNTAGARPGAGGTGFGGGMYVYGSQNINLTGNRILGNTANEAGGYGGGVHITSDTSFTMTNNIVAGNRSSYFGGGLSLETYGGRPVTGTLLHNTFVANSAGSGEGRVAIWLTTGEISLALVNNLLSNHSSGLGVAFGSTATLTRTLFYGNSGGDWIGGGAVVNNLPITGLDPLLDAAYHLRAGSPAIDAGVNAGVTTDIDGDSRPRGTDCDIGADEFVQRRSVYLPVVLKRR